MWPPAQTLSCLLAIALVLAPTGEARAKPAQSPRHVKTGFVFPASVGSFQRTGVHHFNAQKTEMSAGYSSRIGVLTVYVYPARPPYSSALPSHFAQCQHEIRASWGTVKSISKRSTAINRHGRKYAGLEELFSGTVPGTKDEAGSWLVVFQREGHYVKFRFTFPKAAVARAPAELRLFLDKFPWPR